MSVWLALHEGTIVEAIMREDRAAGGYTSIVEWRTVEKIDEEMSLARQITITSDLAAAFAKAVECYYDFRMRLG